MITAGIDVGSSAAKAVIFEGTVLGLAVKPTGWDPKEAGEEVFRLALEKAGVARAEVVRVIGTGYGRISLPFIDRKVTEITCHAKGAAHLFPGTRTVIDIGGQDCKVITLDQEGNVQDFVMNDKCAAGTGRFLQVMTGVLDITLDELGQLAHDGEPAQINSMCTVFAESEIIGLLAQGVAKGAIVAGIVHSIANRMKSLTGRVSCLDQVTFTGGLAQNPSICAKLSTELGLGFNVPAQPQIVGALGAALIARE
ncbi:MAG: acyl-CoA dehydratase activase [Thermincolia bacterium]